jgi:HlyD family secretion protein
LNERLEIEYNSFKRDSILTTLEHYSKESMMNKTSEYLVVKAQYEDLLIEINNLELELQQTHVQILNDKNALENKMIFYKSRFKELKNNLFTEIEFWEDNYLLKAEKSGKVVFTSIWSDKQSVNSNLKVFTIIPSNGGKIIGRHQMPTYGSGMVKIGQKVVVKLNDFPFRKYGSIEGKVHNISKISELDKTDSPIYLVEVNLPKGMVTNYDKELDFTQNMSGVAEIITEENRLLEKIYLPIKEVIVSKL